MNIYSYSSSGHDGDLVHIEINLFKRSLPGVDIVGLPGGAVRESRVRFRSAIINSGYDFPKGRIIINMAPAGKKKQGASFDLPFACSIISYNTPKEDKDFLIIGELKLDGSVRKVNGIISAITKAYECGVSNFIIPYQNRVEAGLANIGNIYPVKNLKEAYKALNGEIDSYIVRSNRNKSGSSFEDYYELKGQEDVKRGLEVSVSGGHNILLFGPPGVGKTMAVNRISSILPDLSKKESLETTKIWSLAGKLKDDIVLIRKPPVRKPFHGASLEGIVGGGSNSLPGEVSLAHNGYLFLDEIPEFKSSIIQSLREPLEDQRISLNRASLSTWFPANFRLIATANPCPCGNLGKSDGVCMCNEKEIRTYWKRLGGAIMDRIDIRIPVKPVDSKLIIDGEAVSSREMKSRVDISLGIQKERFKGENISCNGRIPPGDINRFCSLDKDVKKTFNRGVKTLNLSSRGCHSVLKISRTIADLNGSFKILEKHVVEALNFRRYGDGDYYFN